MTLTIEQINKKAKGLILSAAMILSLGDTELANFAMGYAEASLNLGQKPSKKQPTTIEGISGAATLLFFMEKAKTDAMTKMIQMPEALAFSKYIEQTARRGRQIEKRRGNDSYEG